MKRILLTAAAAAALAGLVFAYKLVLGKPFAFNHAVERVTLRALLRDPETLSVVGLLDNTPLDFHSDKLTDASPAYEDAVREDARRGLALIRRYDRGRLSRQEQLTYDIFSAYLADIVESERFPYHINNVMHPGPYPVNQLSGVQSEVPALLESSHRVVDVRSGDHYVKRLKAIAGKFDQVLESLKAREAAGVIPPRFAVTKVITQVEKFVAAAATDNVLSTSFAAKLEGCKRVGAADRARLERAAAAAIEDRVYPAYRKLLGYLKGLEQKATGDDGVWKLPNGDEYYRWVLRFHTTTAMSPEEIHALGLKEVQRVESEMQAILAGQGYRGASVAELMSALSKEERFLYPDTDQGREQMLADYAAILREIDARIDGVFAIRPRRTVEVRRVPVFKEKTAAGAYYLSPSLDGSRPGVFYANLRSVKDVPKFGMRTLAYHEAVPGHHIQMALAQEVAGMPTFRRAYPFTAHTEGWALYAERLAWEMGLQQDPFSNLGRLQAELFRSVRLVVDTGLHWKRWTREQAIAYMLAKTGMPEAEVVAEVERYLVQPGQACAYKVGMIRILEMRERARRALGGAFDLREFHAALLRNGSVPLDVLDRIIDDWIAETKRR
jgi:uncharacterized protein (DUF885 family)